MLHVLKHEIEAKERSVSADVSSFERHDRKEYKESYSTYALGMRKKWDKEPGVGLKTQTWVPSWGGTLVWDLGVGLRLCFYNILNHTDFFIKQQKAAVWIIVSYLRKGGKYLVFLISNHYFRSIYSQNFHS